MKIGTQIIIVTFLVAIITILSLLVTSVYYFNQYAREVLEENTHYGMAGMKDYIESEMMKVKEFRDLLAANETIPALIV